MIELIIIAVILGLDQYSKHLVDINLMPLGSTLPVFPDVFHITSAHNTGAAFSMLSNGRWFITAVAVITSVAIAFILYKERKKMGVVMRICLALILAGAIGNLFDRITLGYVRDMFDFRLINFAIFNVADSAVSVGGVLLAIDVFFGKGKAYIDSIENGTIFKSEKSKAAENEAVAVDALLEGNSVSPDDEGADESINQIEQTGKKEGQ